MGLEALMSWGPEKMLITCSKETQHPAVDPKTSGWASKRTRKTQRDGHNSGVKIWSLCSVSSTLSHANLEQPFRTLAIKWEANIFLKKSSCVVYYCICYHCVGMYPVYICMQHYYIIEISQNTEKSPGDLRIFAVTQTSVKDHQQMLRWKTFKE